MNRKTISFLLLILGLVASACSPAATPTAAAVSAPTSTPVSAPPTETPTSLPPMVTTNRSADCYSGPGKEDYMLVASIESGTQMNVVGKDASGSYWIVMDPKSNKGCWLESQSASAQGETSALPILIAPPVVAARPNAPENLKITYQCSKTPTIYGNQIYTVKFTITWDDKSNNETGFEIYKNDTLLQTVDANVTTAIDVFETRHAPSGNTIYTVLALNDVGKSIRVEQTIKYACK